MVEQVELTEPAGLDTIAVITGGWSKHELLEAGAVAVFESVEELRQQLDEPPFA